MKVFVVKENSAFQLESGINHKLDYIQNNNLNLINISYLITQNNSSLLNSEKSDVVAIIEYDDIQTFGTSGT